MKERAWREVKALAGDANFAACGVNLEHKVLECQDTAVYSNAVNIAMSHGCVV
jgi:hypothetical protein